MVSSSREINIKRSEIIDGYTSGEITFEVAVMRLGALLAEAKELKNKLMVRLLQYSD